MKCNAGLGIDFGIFKLFLTGNGGVRVGAKLGDTYISHKVVKPNRKKKQVALLSETVSA